MKKMFLIVIVIFLSNFNLIGCAVKTKLVYSLKQEDIVKSNVKYPIRVGIAILEDVRPDEEKSEEDRKKVHPKEYKLFTSDKSFREESIPIALSKMVANHLDYAGLFTEVEFIDMPSNNLIGSNISIDIKNSYEAIFIGKIKHFYGYHKPNAGARGGLAPLMAFGAVGGAIYGGMLATIYEPIEGHTYLIELELLDIQNNQKLWKGEVEYHIKESKNLMSPQLAALLSLKGAVNKLVTKLAEERDKN